MLLNQVPPPTTLVAGSTGLSSEPEMEGPFSTFSEIVFLPICPLHPRDVVSWLTCEYSSLALRHSKAWTAGLKWPEKWT